MTQTEESKYVPKHTPAEHLAALVFGEVVGSIAAGDVYPPAHDDFPASVAELDGMVERLTADGSWWDGKDAWPSFVRHAERALPVLLASVRSHRVPR